MVDLGPGFSALEQTAGGGWRFSTTADTILPVGSAIILLMTASKNQPNIVPSMQQQRSA